MFEIRTTETFDRWFGELRDLRGKARIQARIDRFEAGNPGDVRSVGDQVSEMRVSVGPGYRVYLTRRDRLVVILLCGGDKSSQTQDIRTAKKLVAQLG